MTEHLQVGLVVEAGDAAIGTDEGQDVVHLKPQLMAREGTAGFRVFAHLRGLEAAALAGPAGAASSGSASVEPDVVALELTGVLVGAVGGAPGRQFSPATRETADPLREIHAGHE